PPDRTDRTGGHGVLLRATEGLREVPGGLRAGRDAPFPRSEQVRGGGQAIRPLRDETRAGRRPRGRGGSYRAASGTAARPRRRLEPERARTSEPGTSVRPGSFNTADTL